MAPHSPCLSSLVFFLGLLEVSNGFLSSSLPLFLLPSINVHGLHGVPTLPLHVGGSVSPSWNVRPSLVGLSMKGKGAAKKQPPSPSPPPVSIERIKLADGATAEKFRSVPPPELSEKETKSQYSTTNVTKGYVSRRLPPQWLKVDFDECLGAGGYGDTYEATIIGGPFKGTRAVAKRSLDGHRSGDTMSKTTSDSIAVRLSHAPCFCSPFSPLQLMRVYPHSLQASSCSMYQTFEDKELWGASDERRSVFFLSAPLRLRASSTRLFVLRDS